jgi:hypothetical protein
MQKLKIKLEENPFCSSPEITNLSNYLWFKEYQHLFRQHANINFINLLLGYEQKITATTDLFKFIDSDSIDNLRNGRTVLIFDATFEGYGDAELPLKTCLCYNAFLYNIDPAKIFLFTGNFIVEDNISINIIPIFLLDAGWDGGFNWNNPLVRVGLENVDSTKLTCSDNFEKLVLSLSRRNRYYRVMAHFALYNSSIKNDSIISQDVLSNTVSPTDNTLKKLNLSVNNWQEFKNSLPLLADGNNFHINAPFDHLPELHSKTIFSIVNETLISNYNNTSLFFSEKFLKPIINLQPMIIYGQQGINRKIQMLGFKTYEQYFDLSFDDEPDDVLRYKKLLISVENTVKHLRSLSRDKQIEWRFKESELLIYNREVFIRKENTMKQLEVFSKKLTSIFQTKS